MREPLFAFEQVTVGEPGALRLDRLDGELPAAGLSVVVGPSGAGKSTLLRLCDRLEAPASGVVRLRGDDLASCEPLALRREVGMVFQQPVLFAGSVADNLREADTGADDERVAGLLERVGLDAGFGDRDAGRLSGGEGQRVCLARSLGTDPRVLLMDEPTSALDGRAASVLERLARELVDGGIPVVWVTHDEAQMRRLADYVLVLEDGRAARSGPAAEVLGGV